jgi:NADPH-dependent 2,4-dienoyl-CoA reductase/sulfur reductase-like enzyme/ferredoxin
MATQAPVQTVPAAAQITPRPNPFPNYTQVKSRVPIWGWHVGRVLSVAAAITECVLLLTDRSEGLKLWWKLAIPLLPLLWLSAPGLWRNLCPLAASNQTPRLFKFTRGLTIPDWYREYAPVGGMVAFIAIVASRKVYFNDSSFGTMLLIGGSLVGALIGGIVFKGKSGWCSSICPLLPVQRVYGQEPYVNVPNSHCQPCLGCTKNCYDFNPRVAYLADMYDPDPHYTGYRRLFVGLFPGLIVCYFTLPEHPSAGYNYGHFAVYMGVSAAIFFLLETFLKTSVVKVTTLFGAAAISTYYWYAPKTLAETWFGDSNVFVWALRGVVWALALGWLVRNLLKEKVFVEATQTPADAASTVAGGLAAARAARAGNPEVTIAPSGLRLVAKPGATLLDMLEKAEAPAESGCRIGVCGADPVCVVSGMENLSPIGSDEQGTLDRLGFAENTRMACCARIQGPVEVSPTPERVSSKATKQIEGFAFDPEVTRVVVIGNGIAGVTAADHVRRRHPDCTIDVVADEPYPLYNRMGIARLVYGSSALVGLQLLPQAWYDDNRVTCYLNTAAQKIDTAAREVTLGTGETLAYDRLILAMGSDSFTPPLDGYGVPGTFVLRRAADAFAIRSFVQRHHAQSAVIAGGGLLGLEAAYAIRKVGPAVTVLERGTRLLSRQLDERSAELLREYLEGLGLKIQIGAETASLKSEDGRLNGVELKDGRTLPADVFLVAAGITPLVELARAAGIEVGRGVVVDDALRTSADGVFAIGDLAEHRGRIYGLWPAAVEQGEVAAENAVGGARTYEGTVPVTILKVVGVELLSIGRFEGEAGDTVIVLEDGEEHSYRKLVISDGEIVGAILIARQSDAPLVTAAAKDRRDVSALIEQLERGDWECLGAAEPKAAAVGA